VPRKLIIERYAEPLSPDSKGRPQRGQLYQAVFGEAGEPDVTYRVGSPAPWATVKAAQERIYSAE
jgi:hypothetical protein